MVSEKCSILLDSQNVHDYETTSKILLKQNEYYSQHRFSQGQRLNGAAWGWSPQTQTAETSQRSMLGCTSGSITQPESFPEGLLLFRDLKV